MKDEKAVGVILESLLLQVDPLTIIDGEPNAEESKLLAAGNDDEVRLASGSDVRSVRPPKPTATFSSREEEAEIPQGKLKCLAARSWR